jgi:hypothetical protein
MESLHHAVRGAGQRAAGEVCPIQHTEELEVDHERIKVVAVGCVVRQRMEMLLREHRALVVGGYRELYGHVTLVMCAVVAWANAPGTSRLRSRSVRLLGLRSFGLNGMVALDEAVTPATTATAR